MLPEVAQALLQGLLILEALFCRVQAQYVLPGVVL